MRSQFATRIIATCLLALFARCGAADAPAAAHHFDAIVVKDIYGLTDGGTIVLSALVERDGASESYHIRLSTPFAENTSHPNRLFLNKKLVEYGSKEESEVLELLKQILLKEDVWRAIREYCEYQMFVTIDLEELEQDSNGPSDRQHIPPRGTAKYLQEHLPPPAEKITLFCSRILENYRPSKVQQPKHRIMDKRETQSEESQQSDGEPTQEAAQSATP